MLIGHGACALGADLPTKVGSDQWNVPTGRSEVIITRSGWVLVEASQPVPTGDRP